ncbi:MAG: glycosyltransferase [Lachnospiraceae bacterium]|nr:glycosyltransferase [Lachnospiraceae bacterium]
MNILFFTAFQPCANKGGTERTTITLAKSFRELYGWDSYAAYVVEDGSGKEDCFQEICRVDEKKCVSQIEELIRKWKIDCFIDQGELRISAELDRSGLEKKCRLILAYHFEPEWDNTFFTRKRLTEELKGATAKKKLTNGIKLLFFPYFRKRYVERLRRYCNQSCHNADAVVLLSEGYRKAFAAWGSVGEEESAKFHAIPNALTYPNDYTARNIYNKEKRVLIVSRLEETQKRISLALDIWKKVKEDPAAKGWALSIVGSGEDEALYRTKVEQEKIPNVAFYGRKEPREYYERSAIFLMTSKSEGWPLTISEALQFGVVPVVYDTVAAFQEMIENEKNGMLIRDGAEEEYRAALLKLMTDEEYRFELAKEGIARSARFEPEAIAARWKELICGL